MRASGFAFWTAVSLAVHAIGFALLSLWPGPSLPPSPRPVRLTVGFLNLPLTAPAAGIGNARRSAAGELSSTAKPALAPASPVSRSRQKRTPPRPVSPRRAPSPAPRAREKNLPPVPHPASRRVRRQAPSRPTLPVRKKTVPSAAPKRRAMAPPKSPSMPSSPSASIPRHAALYPVGRKRAGRRGRPARAGGPQAAARTGATPSYSVNPPPRYPALARSNGWEGEVLLRVEVTAGGEAAAVRVVRSSGYALLDRSAVEAVRGWRFHPARIGEKPVLGVVKVPIRFELRRDGE